MFSLAPRFTMRVCFALCHIQISSWDHVRSFSGTCFPFLCFRSFTNMFSPNGLQMFAFAPCLSLHVHSTPHPFHIECVFVHVCSLRSSFFVIVVCLRSFISFQKNCVGLRMKSSEYAFCARACSWCVSFVSALYSFCSHTYHGLDCSEHFFCCVFRISFLRFVVFLDQLS